MRSEETCLHKKFSQMACKVSDLTQTLNAADFQGPSTRIWTSGKPRDKWHQCESYDLYIRLYLDRKISSSVVSTELANCNWAHAGMAKKWPGVVAAVFAIVEQSLNGAKWRWKLSFDQDIEWRACGIVVELRDCCLYHVNDFFLSEFALLGASSPMREKPQNACRNTAEKKVRWKADDAVWPSEPISSCNTGREIGKRISQEPCRLRAVNNLLTKNACVGSCKAIFARNWWQTDKI